MSYGRPPFTPGVNPTSGSTTYMLEETHMNRGSDIWSYNVLVYSAEKKIFKNPCFCFLKGGVASGGRTGY